MAQLYKWFCFRAYGTDLRTETMAGFTMFVSMLYMVVLVPIMLSVGGVDFNGAYTAAILSSVVGTLLIGIVGNYPLIVAPGLGLNAYLVFGVVVSHGYGWQDVFGAVFLASFILMVLVAIDKERTFIQAVPPSLRAGITAGVGFLLVLQGLESGKLIVGSPMTVTMLGDLSEPAAFLTVMGLFVALVLLVRHSRGALLWSILTTAFIALLQGFLVLQAPLFALPEGLDKTVFQLRMTHMDTLGLTAFVVLLVLLLDTMGVVLGVNSKLQGVRKQEIPERKILLSVAAATCIGAILGTGPITGSAASGTGTAEGGRTGFCAVFAALLLLLMVFCAPLVKTLSEMPAIVAPSFILAGFFMIKGADTVNWHDTTEAFPMVAIMVLTPLSGSIATGIGAGFLLYAFLKLSCGQGSQVHPLLYVIAGLFMLQFVSLNL